MLYRQTTNILQVHVLESQPSTAWYVFCLSNGIKTKLLRSPLRTIKKTALTKCFSLCLDICLHRNKMFLRKSYEKNLCVSLCYLRALFSITYFNKNIMHIGSLYLKTIVTLILLFTHLGQFRGRKYLKFDIRPFFLSVNSLHGFS